MFSFLSRGDVSGYNVVGSSVPAVAAWDVAGIWSKIEDYQHQTILNPGDAGYDPTTGLDSTHTWFPLQYVSNPNSASSLASVFGQLADYTWYRGIQYTVRWGEVERSAGVFNFAELDYVVNTVRDLYSITGKTSARNKKVQFLLSYKAFSPTAINDILPPDLQTTGAAYPNGATRYDRAMGFNSGYAGRVVNGYAPRLQDFRAGLTGNDLNGDPIYTLRDRYYAFITAVYNRYKDNPAFGGFVNTEPTPADPNDFYDSSELVTRVAYFNGRLALLQKMKEIVTKHFVADASDLHNDWGVPNVSPRATEILSQNRLAFINPNYYTGLNLEAIYTAASTLSGVVPIIQSCQGLDMDSMSGFFIKGGLGSAQTDIYDFIENPTAAIFNAGTNFGNPTTAIQNSHMNQTTGAVITFDPPNHIWILHRARYLKANMLVVQHNYANVGNKNAPRFNWSEFAAAVNANTTLISPNTGGLIQNDPDGGMWNARPLYIAGEP